MLKYKCNACGQQVVAMAAPDPSRMKCPRCGGITDTTAKTKAKPDTPPAGAMVGNVIETERLAAQRRAEAEAAEAERRDAAAIAALEKHHERAAHIKQMGGAAHEPKAKSWVVSLFVYAAVFMVVAAGVVTFFQSRAGDAEVSDEAFAQVEHGAAAQQMAEAWARRLFPHRGVQVYTVVYDSVSEPRPGLVMIKGRVLAGAQALSTEQVSALEAKASKAPVKGTSAAQLQQDMKVLKDAYDPDKITEAATGQRSPAKPAEKKPDAAEELRELGYDTPSTLPDVDVKQEAFACVVQRGADDMAGPSGVALDYFAWTEGKTSQADRQMSGSRADAVKAAAEHVFETIGSGGAFHPLLATRSADEAERMFPSQYKPRAWRALRADRLPGGAARVFIRVKDANVNLSGTWLVDMTDAGGAWRVIGTWPPQ